MIIPLLQDGSPAHDGSLSFSESTSREVSWQSACWPIIACMVTVMMQNTGRVLGANHVLSAALRASPLVCVLDTVMMIAEFVCLLNVGCSITTAARHVWYGRFEHESAQSLFNLPHSSIRGDERSSSVFDNSEVLRDAHLVAATASTSNSPESLTVSQAPTHSADGNFLEGTETPGSIHHQDTNTPPTERGAVEVSPGPTTPSRDIEAIANRTYLAGSSIDHNWRQSIFAFTLGAAPQALKVFAMRGTPITQAFTSIYVTAFLVPELFRLAAGSAGGVVLRPMPIVTYTTKAITQIARILYSITAGCAVSSQCTLLVTLCLSHESHTAIQALLFIGPTCMVTWGLVQMLVWLSRSHILASPLACIKRLWSVDFKAIRYRISGIVAKADLINFYTVLVSTSFETDVVVYSVLLFIGSTVTVQLVLITVSVQIPLTPSPVTASLLPLHIFFMKLVLAMWFGFVTFPCMSLLLYNILFVGSFSNTPRRLTGIKGSMGEFVAGYVLLSSLFTAFYMYSQSWTSKGTHKPAWADYLG